MYNIPLSFQEPLAFQEQGGESRSSFPCTEMGLQKIQFLLVFFFFSLFSCPGIFPWPDEYLNKNMVRGEQERGEKTQERT